MAAFKEELSQIYITLFGVSFSLLVSAFPMIVGILLSTYLGALAHFASNLTITKVPLSKFLSFISSTIAILSLVYPLILIILLVMSWTVEVLELDTQLIERVFLTVMLTASIASILFSLLASKALTKLRTQKSRVELLQRMHERHINQKSIDGYEFFRLYEALINYAASYLKLQGYGFGGRSLVSIAKILANKGVLSQQDAKRANELNTLRNRYAHGQKGLKAAQLRSAIEDIEQLKMKIEKALYDNFDDTNSK